MLKQVREAKGFSQNQLADVSGVNVRMIQHYEQGVKNIDGAHLETLVALSIALECCVSDILNDAELIKRCKITKL